MTDNSNHKAAGIAVIIDSQEFDNAGTNGRYGRARLYFSQSYKTYEYLEFNAKYDAGNDCTVYTVSAITGNGEYINVKNDHVTMSAMAALVASGIVDGDATDMMECINDALNPAAIVKASMPGYENLMFPDIDFGE